MKKTNEKTVEKEVFRCIITSPGLSRQEKIKIANRERFRQKLFLVSDLNRVELKELSDSLSVFTVFNIYNINHLSLSERVRHFIGKLRAAALRKIGASEVIVVIV